MRVSTNQIYQSGLSAMQRAQSARDYTGLQLATKQRILTPSDDPGGSAQAVQLNAAIKATEQYQRNSNYAKPRLEQEHAQMDALENVLQQVRERVVAGNSDYSYNQQDRKIIASEIRQFHADIVGMANIQDANGEYLFAGTRSQKMPFVVGDQGQVSYVGAEGAGAVREIAITGNRRIATGDTGDSVFMAIPERSGLLTEVVPKPGSSPNLTAPGVEMKTSVANLQESLNSAGQTFRIQFHDDAGGSMQYRVLDLDGNSVKDVNGGLIGGPYVPNEPINFAGRRLTLTVPLPTTSGTLPANGDEILSRPVTQVSLFKTLDDLATAFEGTGSREDLSQATSMALRNLSAGLERVNEVRTSVGIRLNDLDMLTGLNQERVLDLKTTLSDIVDLDYAEAISRYKLQEVVLQAAQQTYVQTSRLSLFDFMR